MVIFNYMVGAEDVGSYKNAYNHTLKNFSAKEPSQMAKNSGNVFDPIRSIITIHSMGQIIDVKYPEGAIRFNDSPLSPLWSWRLIMLNHLARSDNAPLAGSLITFKELDGGYIFNPAYYKMTILPIINNLSDKPAEQIKSACSALGADFKDEADICAVFNFLPRFPITLKIWLSDAEMAGSANILFDAAANHYLHTEDIAVTASLMVTFLLNQCGIATTP